jgi:DNA-binding CsgD family transcriptional regulator
MSEDQARGNSCHCKSAAGHLTEREIEVLLLVASGQHNKQIALALGISTRTVDHHLRAMLVRAGANSRAELIARCYVAGILDRGTWPPAWSGAHCLTCVGQRRPCPSRDRL